MPVDDDDKAAKQAKLSKALSAAYLTHQITELESKVNTPPTIAPNQGNRVGQNEGRLGAGESFPTLIEARSKGKNDKNARKAQGQARKGYNDLEFPPLGAEPTHGQNLQVLKSGQTEGNGVWDSQKLFPAERQAEQRTAEPPQPEQAGREHGHGRGDRRDRDRRGRNERAKKSGRIDDSPETTSVSAHSGHFRHGRSHGSESGRRRRRHGHSRGHGHNGGRGHSHTHDHGHGHDGGRGGRGRGRGGKHGNGRDRGSVSDLEFRSLNRLGQDGSDDEDAREWRVVVLDSSALLWAPKTVRKLVGQGIEIIVPIEALRTLDLLKTGSSPSARAARAATRYIEHSSRHHRFLDPEGGKSRNTSSKGAKNASASNGPIAPECGCGSYRRGRGLRIQQENENRAPEEVSTLPIPPAIGEEEVLPKWMLNILSCAAYFTGVQTDLHKSEDPGSPLEGMATLMVAMPSFESERRDDLGASGSGLVERGEGFLVSQEAQRFEIPLEVLRDEEVHDEERGGGRGRGRGGRKGERGRGGRGTANAGAGRGGGGEAEEQEEERAVKILLRRPTSDIHAGSQHSQIGEENENRTIGSNMTQGAGTDEREGMSALETGTDAAILGDKLNSMSILSPSIPPPTISSPSIPPPLLSSPSVASPRLDQKDTKSQPVQASPLVPNQSLSPRMNTSPRLQSRESGLGFGGPRPPPFMRPPRPFLPPSSNIRPPPHILTRPPPPFPPPPGAFPGGHGGPHIPPGPQGFRPLGGFGPPRPPWGMPRQPLQPLQPPHGRGPIIGPFMSDPYPHPWVMGSASSDSDSTSSTESSESESSDLSGKAHGKNRSHHHHHSEVHHHSHPNEGAEAQWGMYGARGFPGGRGRGGGGRGRGRVMSPMGFGESASWNDIPQGGGRGGRGFRRWRGRGGYRDDSDTFDRSGPASGGVTLLQRPGQGGLSGRDVPASSQGQGNPKLWHSAEYGNSDRQRSQGASAGAKASENVDVRPKIGVGSNWTTRELERTLRREERDLERQRRRNERDQRHAERDRERDQKIHEKEMKTLEKGHEKEMRILEKEHEKMIKIQEKQERLHAKEISRAEREVERASRAEDKGKSKDKEERQTSPKPKVVLLQRPK